MSKNNYMNDLLYGDLLSSPGYDVNYAVGMTYSLDLEALLAVPLSIGALGELDEITSQTPLCLLEAIQKSKDKFVVFCNKGEIKVPKKANKIFSLLESSVREVSGRLSDSGEDIGNWRFSNFHPKMWIIRETSREDKTDSRMKVIILSRNLTFDNSLDVAVSMTGKIMKGHVDSTKQQPLIELLNDLTPFADSDQRKKIKDIMDGLNHVERFDLDDTTYDDYDFIVFNNRGKIYTTMLDGSYRPVHHKDIRRLMQGTDVMIFSPFIDQETIDWMNDFKNRGYRFLVTRRENVTSEILELCTSRQSSVYVMKERMIDNELSSIDIHAKMYFVAYPRGVNANYLFLGSANATTSAFGPKEDKTNVPHLNTELLVRLRFKRSQNRAGNFKDSLIDEDDPGCRFERVTEPLAPETDKQSRYSDSERIFKYLISGNYLKANCSASENDLYDVRITFYKSRFIHTLKLYGILRTINPESFSIKAIPIQIPSQEKDLEDGLTFSGLRADCLSEYYTIRVTSKIDETDTIQGIVKIPTDGIPAERETMILRSLIDTKDKFMDYVSLVMTDSPELTIQDIYATETVLAGKEGKTVSAAAGTLYEQMLRIAATDPKRFERISEVADKLDSSVIPEDFKQMYDKFRTLLPKLKKI